MEIKTEAIPNYFEIFPHLVDPKLFLGVLIRTKMSNKFINVTRNVENLNKKYYQVTDIINLAVKMSLQQTHKSKVKNDVSNRDNLNHLEKLACELQLGCLTIREMHKHFVDKQKMKTSMLPVESGLNCQILSWRNVAALKECNTCKKKDKLLRKCKRCNIYYFCSKKMSKN